MFTAAAVPAAITLHSLGVAVLRFAFHPDMAQLPSSMADVIALIFTDGTGHVIAPVSYTHLDVYKRQEHTHNYLV